MQNVPLALPQAVQTELVSNLRGVHRVRQVLLVRKDQQQGVTQLVLVEHALQLLASLGNTLTVVGVDHEDNTLRVLEVLKVSIFSRTVAPQRTDLVLTTDIPHGERDVLVLDSLDVEAWPWLALFRIWRPKWAPNIAYTYRWWGS